MGELIHIRIDKKMRNEMNAIVEAELFSNTTEFVRDAIRKNIEQYKTNRAKILLEQAFKSSNGKRPTRSERAEAVSELLKLKKLA